MHIPDGFLSVKVSAATWVISLCGIALCLKKVTARLKDKMIPLMGVMSAFVFAAQMLNFPIFAGTSGHLLASALASILLGPYAAAIVMTCVLVVQCFLFQDGGITALGANILNMALVAAIGGYGVYSIAKKMTGIIVATAMAAWLSVVLASSVCALELAASGTVALTIVLPAMALAHALTGGIEAAVTCLIINFILKVRKDLLYKP